MCVGLTRYHKCHQSQSAGTNYRTSQDCPPTHQHTTTTTTTTHTASFYHSHTTITIAITTIVITNIILPALSSHQECCPYYLPPTPLPGGNTPHHHSPLTTRTESGHSIRSINQLIHLLINPQLRNLAKILWTSLSQNQQAGKWWHFQRAVWREGSFDLSRVSNPTDNSDRENWGRLG